MRLQYDVSIVGLAAIDRALAGIEKRFARHNAALTKAASRARGAVGPAGQDPLVAAEEKRHQRAMAHIRAERAAMVAGERERSRASERAYQRQASRDRFRQEASNRSVARTLLGGVGRGIGNVARAVGTYGAMALGIGGGMLFHQTLSANRAGESAARGLANQSFGDRAERNAIFNAARSTAKVTSRTSGFTQEQVLGSMRAFAEKSGTPEPASRLADFFARVSDATGAELPDVGLMAGQIYKAGSLKGYKGAELEDMVKRLTGVFVGQGMGGQIEIKDFAGLVGRLTATAQGFEGDFFKNAQSLGAVAQMSAAGGGSTSPEEAMTAISRFRSDLVKKGGDLKGKFVQSGIDVFTDKTQTQLRDPAQIIMDAVAKTKGNMPALVEMFGERGIRAVEGFRSVYTDAGGGAEGEKAMRDTFAQYMGLALDEKGINERADDTRQTQSKRWDMIMRDLEQKLGPSVERIMMTLIPAFEKLAPYIEKAAEKLADFIEWFASNPTEGLAAILAASVTAEVGKSALGEVLKNAVIGALGGGGGGAGLLGNGSGVGSALGASLGPALAVPLALAVGAALMPVLSSMWDKFRAKAEGKGDGVEVPLDWQGPSKLPKSMTDASHEKKDIDQMLFFSDQAHDLADQGTGRILQPGYQPLAGARWKLPAWKPGDVSPYGEFRMPGVDDVNVDPLVTHEEPQTIKLEGADQIETAAKSLSEMNELPAHITAALDAWAASNGGKGNLNRGSGPSTP